jgi:hypothetical protein
VRVGQPHRPVGVGRAGGAAAVRQGAARRGGRRPGRRSRRQPILRRGATVRGWARASRVAASPARPGSHGCDRAGRARRAGAGIEVVAVLVSWVPPKRALGVFVGRSGLRQSRSRRSSSSRRRRTDKRRHQQRQEHGERQSPHLPPGCLTDPASPEMPRHPSVATRLGQGHRDTPRPIALVVVGAAPPVAPGRAGPEPGSQPSGAGTVGAVAGEQALDGLGGLPVQVTLPVAGGTAADQGRRADDCAVHVGDDNPRADRVQRSGARLLRAEVVGGPSGRSARRNDAAATRTPSSATGRSRSYRILPGGERANTAHPPFYHPAAAGLVRDAAAARCRPVVRMRHR